MLTVHEIKDEFLHEDTIAELTKNNLVFIGLNTGLANEIIREWTKLKEKDLTNYPKGIEAKNAHVAKFMGWNEMKTVRKDWMLTEIIEGTECAKKQKALKDMEFSTSWDWLIPVCSKALDICMAQERPSPNHCSYFDWMESQIATSLREYNKAVTFEFVIDFIYYYNKRNETVPNN